MRSKMLETWNEQAAQQKTHLLRHLVTAVHGFLPQLHLQFTSSHVEMAAEGRGHQLLLALLLQVISSHLQVPEEVRKTFAGA